MPNFRKDVPDERGLTASSNNDTTSQHESTHELIAADSARDCLLALQSENGWWAGRSAIQIGWIARYVLVEYWMDESHSDLAVASSDWLLANDSPSGGWARWAPQSEFDLSTSVLVYLSLRLTGVEAEHPTMLNAKKSIIAAGGASRCDAFAKYYLALFGQLPWNACPPLIPEMEWLPRWLQSSPRNRSEWSRLLLLPLSVLWEKRPRKVIRREDAIRELFSPTEIPRYQNTLFESALVGLNSLRIRPFRKAALDKLTQWIETRITHRDGLAGSFDSTLISIVALISQGSSRDSQPLATAIEHVRNRIQECVVEGSGTVAEAKLHISPVCDTAAGWLVSRIR
jgi:squalene-hopene/tetraprenyl-beta-curcumene cyclase